MNKKIAIIGGGLFGSTIYITLKRKGYDCTLFERNNDLLLGASTNNLNRVHFGYHYPRDDQTAKQSHKGYVSFKKFYKGTIIKDFKNYYLIAENSKVNLKDYLKFCTRNNLNFKIINESKLKFDLKHIQGGIEVKEPIYDWKSIKKKTKFLIKRLRKNQIHFNENIKEVRKSNTYEIITDKNSYNFDFVVDTTYDQSNSLIKKISKLNKNKYQLVVVFEFIPSNFKKMGLALMDGNFFSFLPKGNQNKHLIYHVKYSILKEKIANEFPKAWLNTKKFNSQIKKSKESILKELKKYLPNLRIKFTKNKFINPRVLPAYMEKSDKRISKINEISKNYFQVFSAKVDHSVDISKELLKKINRKK